MAAITARGGKYQVRIRRDGYSTVTKTFTRKADAQRWARQVEADMEAGRWQGGALSAQVLAAPVEAQAAPAAVPTLADAIAEYQKGRGGRLKGAKDYAYRYAIIAAEPFALRPLADLTPADLSAWRERLQQGRKPATVVRVLALVSSVLTWAVVDRGWLHENPMRKVRRPKQGESRTRTLTPKELAYLLRGADMNRERWQGLAFRLLAVSAMRRGELFALTVADVDTSASVLHLHDTKNGHARSVPLAPDALACVRGLVELAQAAGRARLLPVGHVGSISTAFNVAVSRAVALYARDCAVSGVTPVAGFLADVRLHDLRHHAASYWARAGLSMPELMVITGHRSIRMLTRYIHLKPSALAQKLAQITDLGNKDE